MPPLPEYPAATRGDIESMLEQLASAGWPVFAHSEADRYVLAPSPAHRFELRYNKLQRKWVIDAYVNGQSRDYLTAGDPVFLRESLVAVAKRNGFDLSHAPTSVRLSESSPLTNKVSICHLASGSQVLAVFDPYFDDRALRSLVVLSNLGLSLASQVRVLLTSKSAKRLSISLLSDFGTECSVKIEARVCASEREHRRFMLLADGRSIVLGCSLNDLAKNEAAYSELNTVDAEFFSQQWATATQHGEA